MEFQHEQANSSSKRSERSANKEGNLKKKEEFYAKLNSYTTENIHETKTKKIHKKYPQSRHRLNQLRLHQ